MIPRVIKPADEATASYDRIIDLSHRGLASGAVAILPAEGIYGLHLSAAVPGAISSLRKIKGERSPRPFIILIGSPAQLTDFADPPDDAVSEIISMAWPGPVTILLPARSDIPTELTKEGLVALRCPGSDFLRELSSLLPGPLLTTSANPTGQPAPARIDQLDPLIFEAADLIIDGGQLPGYSSTLISFDQLGKPRVLRSGPWLPPHA